MGCCILYVCCTSYLSYAYLMSVYVFTDSSNGILLNWIWWSSFCCTRENFFLNFCLVLHRLCQCYMCFVVSVIVVLFLCLSVYLYLLLTVVFMLFFVFVSMSLFLFFNAIFSSLLYYVVFV